MNFQSGLVHEVAFAVAMPREGDLQNAVMFRLQRCLGVPDVHSEAVYAIGPSLGAAV
jgi:hypothetical protein